MTGPMRVRPTDPRVGHLRQMRREWTMAFVLAEVVGFVPPALAGVALVGAGASDGALVLGLTLAGLLEGLAIGTANAWVLRRHLPRIDGRAWIAASVGAAGFAWLVGLGGSAVLQATGGPLPLVVVMVPLWLVALAGMGGLQWLVLRRTVARSSSWIVVTAAAWLVGVLLPILSLSLVPSTWPAPGHVAAGVTGAVAMGWLVGSVTGRRLEQLVRDAETTVVLPDATPVLPDATPGLPDPAPIS